MRVRKKRQWQFEAFDHASFFTEFDSIYKEERPMKCQVGDWVRFYRDGVSLIGEVEYILESDPFGNTELYTSSGIVDEDTVLERRVKSRKQLLP